MKEGKTNLDSKTTIALLQTSEHRWRESFPNLSRDEFRELKRKAREESMEKNGFAERLYAFLRKKKTRHTFEGLSEHFDVSVKALKAAVSELIAAGKTVSIDSGVELLRELPPQSKPTVIDVSKFKGKKFKFGFTADNHLCSKYARMDVLEALYDIWEAQGITEVYQAGNMIDGEARFNRFDLLVAPGVEAQVDYFVKHWPHRKGITTYFITGDDHEGWYIRDFGIDIGRVMEQRAREAGRTDIVFLGNMEHDIMLKGKKGKSFMRIIHAGGGSSYATSYKAQKIVESYQGGEKPAILLIGHYHKAEYGYPREVHCVQAGCTEDQSPFMRKNNLQAHVGGWTISFEVDDNGIVHAFTPQFHPFYDRGFYSGDRWKYHWK